MASNLDYQSVLSSFFAEGLPVNLLSYPSVSVALHNLVILLIFTLAGYWLLYSVLHTLEAAAIFLKLRYGHHVIQIHGAGKYAEAFKYLHRPLFTWIVRIICRHPSIPVKRLKLQASIQPSSLELVELPVSSRSKQIKRAVRFKVDASADFTVQLYWGVSVSALNTAVNVKSIVTIDNVKVLFGLASSAVASNKIKNSLQRNPLKRKKEVPSNHQSGEHRLFDLPTIAYSSRSERFHFQPGRNVNFEDSTDEHIQQLPQAIRKPVISPKTAESCQETPEQPRTPQDTMIEDNRAADNEEATKADEIIPLVIVVMPSCLDISGSADTFPYEFSPEQSVEVTAVTFDDDLRLKILKQTVHGPAIVFAHEPVDIYGAQQDDEMCSICFSRSKDTILLPCRHSVSCYDCLRSIRQQMCPICRTDYTSFVTFPLKPRSTEET